MVTYIKFLYTNSDNRGGGIHRLSNRLNSLEQVVLFSWTIWGFRVKGLGSRAYKPQALNRQKNFGAMIVLMGHQSLKLRGLLEVSAHSLRSLILPTASPKTLKSWTLNVWTPSPKTLNPKS